MKVNDYGFIVKGKGYNPAINRTVLDSGSFRTTIVGVETSEQALEVAKQMITQEIQIIELCGGFDPKYADEIMEELNNLVPVGQVMFSERARDIMKDK